MIGEHLLAILQRVNIVRPPRPHPHITLEDNNFKSDRTRSDPTTRARWRVHALACAYRIGRNKPARCCCLSTKQKRRAVTCTPPEAERVPTLLQKTGDCNPTGACQATGVFVSVSNHLASVQSRHGAMSPSAGLRYVQRGEVHTPQWGCGRRRDRAWPLPVREGQRDSTTRRSKRTATV